MTINQTNTHYKPEIKVIGLGGCGCNTVNRLSSLKIPGIKLVAVNTNQQDIFHSQADINLLIGEELTHGFGAGGNADIGKKAAEESYKELISIIKGTDILFLTAGMGGGTGSGAVQIAARIAQSFNILTIAMVTLPFSFESGVRSSIAAESTACLQPFINTMITIPNDRLLKICDPETPLDQALARADDLLVQSINGLSRLLNQSGIMNIDFSHIFRLMNLEGGSMISTGTASGQNRVIKSLQNALQHPLIEDIPIKEAKGIIVQFSGNLTLSEIETGINYLKDSSSSEAEILPVISEIKETANQVEVLLLLTGIGVVSLDFHYPISSSSLMDKSNSDTAYHHHEMVTQEARIGSGSEDLKIPAFIRRGYNLVNI